MEKMSVNYSNNLLKNVHEALALPDSGETFLTQGDYEYWHYGCDGFNDRVINYVDFSYPLLRLCSITKVERYI